MAASAPPGLQWYRCVLLGFAWVGLRIGVFK
jgi:hypothetical protein